MAGLSRTEYALRRLREEHSDWGIWHSQHNGRWYALRRDVEDGQFVEVCGTRQLFSVVADDVPTLFTLHHIHVRSTLP